jgi:hypothetical protein
MNLELKEKFFAQYWEQTYIYKNQYGTFKGSLSDDNSIYHFKNHIKNENTCLLLKDVTKVLGNDSIEISKIMGANHEVTQPLKYLSFNHENAIKTIDYLRSKGYAIPFMEYSVDDLISFGWVRLQAEA